MYQPNPTHRFWYITWIFQTHFNGFAQIGGTKVLASGATGLDLFRAHRLISQEEAQGQPVLIMGFTEISYTQAVQYELYVIEAMKMQQASKPKAAILSLVPTDDSPKEPA